MLDDSLAMPGVPNFIAFEGVPLVFAKFGVPSRETSADWCAAEKHAKDWLRKEQPPTLLRNLWLAQRSSHMKPQGGQACCFSLGRLRRGAQVPLAPQHAARSKRRWLGVTCCRQGSSFSIGPAQNSRTGRRLCVRRRHRTPAAHRRALTAACSPGMVVCDAASAAAAIETQM